MITCNNCGQQNDDAARWCVKCGTSFSAPDAGGGAPYAPNTADPNAQQQQGYADPGGWPSAPPPAYGSNQGYMQQTPGGPNCHAMGANKKMAAGPCRILPSAFGVHQFIPSYNTEGIILLAITLVTCFMGSIVTSIIGIIEGVMYLTKSDEEFVRTYVQNKKAWF